MLLVSSKSAHVSVQMRRLCSAGSEEKINPRSQLSCDGNRREQTLPSPPAEEPEPWGLQASRRRRGRRGAVSSLVKAPLRPRLPPLPTLMISAGVFPLSDAPLLLLLPLFFCSAFSPPPSASHLPLLFPAAPLCLGEAGSGTCSGRGDRAGLCHTRLLMSSRSACRRL